MEKIVSLCKRRGFIYQGSEIYGGLAGTYDYGPLGVALRNNIKNIWWRMFVDSRDDMYGLDAAILMHPKVWESSGHVAGFSDPLVLCKSCQTRHRVDTLLTDEAVSIHEEVARGLKSRTTFQIMDEEIKKFLPEDAEEYFSETVEGTLKMATDFEQWVGKPMQSFLNKLVDCPKCHKRDWGVPVRFNMMFQTQIGATEGSISYLRPETAGGIFVNFKNVVDSLHPKLPFGIGQIGKAFRNEIAPRDFIFRVRELEQMEVEYFVKPTEWEESFEEWRQAIHAYTEAVGLTEASVHELEVGDGDRAHYSKRTIDFEFDFPFGRKELFGLAYRGDFDLSAHQTGSSQNLKFAEEGQESFLPHVIEPSLGVERTMLAVLTSAYTEDEKDGDVRVFLKFKPSVAPIKAAVFPLLKNKPELVAKAREVYAALKKEIPQIMWDDNGNVGKRYRRQDEIGTPFCITIDFDTLGDPLSSSGQGAALKDTVTVRDRDTGEQKRVAIRDLLALLAEAIRA